MRVKKIHYFLTKIALVYDSYQLHLVLAWSLMMCYSTSTLPAMTIHIEGRWEEELTLNGSLIHGSTPTSFIWN